MKRYLIKVLIITTVVTSTICCSLNKRIDNKPCQLTLICDSSFRKDLFLEVFLTNQKDTIKFNELKRSKESTRFIWDSLPKGKYTYHIRSIFDHKLTKLLSLQNDTILYEKNKIKIQCVDLISKDELEKADTIVFAFQSNGCSYHFENFTLTKSNSGYALKGSYKKNGIPTRIDKTLSPSIIGSLVDLQIKTDRCIKYEIEHKKERGSTMTSEFYLLARNRMYYYTDYSHCECGQYYKIRNRYIVTQ